MWFYYKSAPVYLLFSDGISFSKNVDSIFYGVLILLGSFAVYYTLKNRYEILNYFLKIDTQLSAPFWAILSFLLTAIHIYIHNLLYKTWHWFNPTPLFKTTLSISNLIFVLLITIHIWKLIKSQRSYITYFIFILLTNVLAILQETNLLPKGIPFLHTIFTTFIFSSAFILIVILTDEVKNKFNNPLSFLPIIITALSGGIFLAGLYLPMEELSPQINNLIGDIYMDTFVGEILILLNIYIFISIKEKVSKNISTIKWLFSCFASVFYIFIFPVYTIFFKNSLSLDMMAAIIWPVSALVFLMIHFFTFISSNSDLSIKEKAYVFFIYLISTGLISSYSFLSRNT